MTIRKYLVSQLLAVCGIFASGSLYAQIKPDRIPDPLPPVLPSPAFAQVSTSTTSDTVSGTFARSPWFTDPAVRQELKLSDAQFDRLNESYTTSWQQYSDNLNKLGKDLNDEQRMERIRKLNDSFLDDYSRSVDSVVTDPAARQRYNQLHWQYRGYGAFNDAYVQKQLNLTPEQRAKVRQAERDWDRQMDQWSRRYADNQDEILRQFNRSRPEFQEGLKSFLTVRQQNTWRDMTGQPYEFPAEIYFPKTIVVNKPALK